MKIKSNIKALGIKMNHNQSTAKSGIPVKVQVKAGGITLNHNQMIVQRASRFQSECKLNRC